MIRKYYMKDKPPGLSSTKWLTDNKEFKKAARIKPKRKYEHSFMVNGLTSDAKLMASQVAERISDADKNTLHPRYDYQTCKGISVNQDKTLSFKDNFYDRMGHTAFSTSTWGGTEVERVHQQFARTTSMCLVSRLHAQGTRHIRDTAIHWDAPLCVETKLILSLNVHPEFEIQYLKYGCIPAGFKLDKFGSVYTFDSSKIHRAYFTERTGNYRTCVLLAFIPWFNFDHIERCWTRNEFFGELHPFDMLTEGHVFKKG